MAAVDDVLPLINFQTGSKPKDLVVARFLQGLCFASLMLMSASLMVIVILVGSAAATRASNDVWIHWMWM